MKGLKLIAAGMILFLAVTLQAQVSVTVNTGTPPPWGPAGYTDVRYYYLPDVEAYYDVQSSVFIYNSGVTWVRRAYLPSRYRSYDLYNGYKVVMVDYHGDAPYKHFKEHKTKYAKGYHGPTQKTYGEHPPKGYYNEKGSGQDNGKGGGHEGKKGKKK
jgi:hypothetical protein